jgi:hypothetical protein
MKKIINHRLYNTETAIAICSTGYSYPGDFKFWKDTLYKTKKGRYFFHGIGGPLSSYAENIGNNNISGSENIWEVTEEEAMEFCLENDVEKAIELFSKHIEQA